MALARRWFPLAARLAALLAPLTVAGCLMTTSQGNAMRADIAKLRERVAAMETRDKEIDEQVARLRTVLDEATALLGRNSADLGTKVARTESDLAAMTGKIEEARYLADQLAKQIAEDRARLAGVEQTQSRLLEDQHKVATEQQKIIERVAPSIPEDKESLWKEAQARLHSGMRDDARRFLRAFVQRFPQDPRAPQAQLQVGLTFAQELKHANAVAEYTAVMSRFSRSPEVAEAMWQLGTSYVALRYCTDAKAIFQDLAKRYPKSPRAAEVKIRLRELAKMAKNKTLCTS
jgi:TolA-binding protein